MDSSFSGKTNISLDERGRMAMPARYRQRVQERCEGRFTITIDLRRDPCLLLYPEPDWVVLMDQLRRLGNLSSAARAIQRLAIGHAAEVEMDAQGRILIPQTLRADVDIEKKITVLGQINKFEIWSEATWEAWLRDGTDPVMLKEGLDNLLMQEGAEQFSALQI